MQQRCIHRDGHVVWVKWSASAVRDGDGCYQYAIVMVEDVTDYKRVEAALRDSEARFRSAYEHAAIGLALISLSGQLFQANPALCNFLGYTEAELQQKHVEEVSYADDVAKDYTDDA